MRSYLDLLARVMLYGTMQQNRTGIAAKRLTGAMLEFDLQYGFPAVTTKKLAFNAVKGELIGFLRGYSNAAQFRELGCGVWDQNANDNREWLNNSNRIGPDDLGRVYGVQWREWRGCNIRVDQLNMLLTNIERDPTSRRLIVNAWNPAELHMMALPPCHMLFQILIDVNSNEMSMVMYQRSCDLFLGVPFNIASYALLLEMIAMVTGYKARRLCMMMADVHVYENHFDQVRTQMARDTKPLPILTIKSEPQKDKLMMLESIDPSDILLVDYDHHPAIKGDMAV